MLRLYYDKYINITLCVFFLLDIVEGESVCIFGIDSVRF